MMAMGGIAAWRIPSAPLAANTSRNPLACLSLLWKHKLFGYMSAAWFFLGIANLSTMPLRTEFAGSSERGLGLDAGLVLTFTLVLPEMVRLLAMMVWSRLFDRINFIVLRILINVFFVASIALYFHGPIWSLVAGSACFGIAGGGGMIAWSLWVTKFSAPERTADYMAVHTFLTGVRGLIGPQIAYAVLGTFADLPIHSLAMVAVGSMVFGTLLFVPIIPHGRR